MNMMLFTLCECDSTRNVVQLRLDGSRVHKISQKYGNHVV